MCGRRTRSASASLTGCGELTEDVLIGRLNARGDGTTQVGGRRVTVPGTLPDERVHIAPWHDARGRVRWRVEAVLASSAERVDPACDQHARCSGCPLRHAASPARAAFAAEAAEFAVRRHLALHVPVSRRYAPVSQDGFRARLSAGVYAEMGAEPVPGMAARGDGPPIDLRRCPAQSAESREALVQLWAEVEELGLTQRIRRVTISANDDGSARVVLSAVMPEDVAALTSAAWMPRPRWTLAVSPRSDGPGVEAEATLVYGPESLPFEVDGDRLHARLTAWTPQTPGSLSTLRAAALDLLACAPESRVLELGCGVGTLSAAIARRCEALVGVDMVRAAAEDAATNMAALGVLNARFRHGRADQAIRRLLAGGERFDRVVLHGMRLPFGEALTNVLPAVRAARIVYIAPSATAMAKDLASLRGYRLSRLEQLEQMPGTAHTLTLGLVEPRA